MNRTLLFMHPTTMKIEKKVRCKDAWGGKFFAIKGTPPPWLEEIPAPVVNEDIKKFGKLALKEIILMSNSRGEPLEEVLKIKRLVNIDKDTEATIDLVELTAHGKKKTYLRSIYLDLLKEFHPDYSQLWICGDAVVAVKKNEYVAAFGSYRPRGEIRTPIQHMREKLKRKSA